MSISFNSIPNNLRVPFAYVEFDNSRAVSGPQAQPYKTLLMGQKLSGGTQAALAPVRITSADEAKSLFGAGSMLAHMAEYYFKNNITTETWAVAMDDAGAGVAATGSISFSGAATEAGVIALYINGRAVKVGVNSGDAANSIVASLASAIVADSDLPTTAVVNGSVDTQLDFTAKNSGETGNDTDLRFNYFGESIPAGISATITPLSGGVTNPDIDAAIATLGDEQYNVIALPYTDTASLTKIDTELENRWGPLTQNDGHAVCCKEGSQSALGTFGDALNSKQITVIGKYKEPVAPYEKAAAVCGVIAFQGPLDPARPMQTLPLVGILPAKIEDRLKSNERNLLLYDGISTTYTDAGGIVRIERLITTYKKNEFGADDTSYLDLNTKLTLSYIRYDWRNTVLRKYPRHKLASDGTEFGTGQAIVTPKIMKAEVIAKFREWENIGLVEGVDQFKDDLIVERNVSDVNRLDISMSPNLINQLRITGTKISYIL